MDYGNKDISEWEGSNINPYEELNGFWLNSSLKISPLQQVKVLKKIFDGQSIYSSQEIAKSGEISGSTAKEISLKIVNDKID